MVFNDLRKVDLKANLSQTEPWKSLNTSQTDIQRLKDGHVGGQVFYFISHVGFKHAF